MVNKDPIYPLLSSVYPHFYIVQDKYLKEPLKAYLIRDYVIVHPRIYNLLHTHNVGKVLKLVKIYDTKDDLIPPIFEPKPFTSIKTLLKKSQ